MEGASQWDLELNSGPSISWMRMSSWLLGVFGFLSTGDSIVPGNNGLKDLVLGLSWIQEHIEAFGGDPGKVTIFGESAGGALVHYLMLSPTTEGLFHRAISQSGTALGPWAYNPDPKGLAVKLAIRLNCSTRAGDRSEISSEGILACLRGSSANEIIEAGSNLFPVWPPGSLTNMLDFGPVKESNDSSNPFLTISPWQSILEGSPIHKNIPWIVGVTEDEGVISQIPFLGDGKLFNELETRWPDLILRMNTLDKYIEDKEQAGKVAQEIRQFYFDDLPLQHSSFKKSFESLSNLNSDGWFVHCARTAALASARTGAPVYLYQYAQRGPPFMINIFGVNVTNAEILQKVVHASDLIALFNIDSFLGTDGTAQSEEDAAFSRNFVKTWASFAIHGMPNHSWPQSKDEWKSMPGTEVEGSSPLKWYRLTSTPAYIDEGEWKSPATFIFWDRLYKKHFLLPLLGNSSQGGRKTELQEYLVLFYN